MKNRLKLAAVNRRSRNNERLRIGVAARCSVLRPGARAQLRRQKLAEMSADVPRWRRAATRFERDRPALAALAPDFGDLVRLVLFDGDALTADAVAAAAEVGQLDTPLAGGSEIELRGRRAGFEQPFFRRRLAPRLPALRRFPGEHRVGG